MINEFNCRKCGTDLEGFNTGDSAIEYCPRCGVKLLKRQSVKLWYKCTDGEIADRIEQNVLNMLNSYDNLDFGDLPFTAWEGEDINGVIFCSDYKADQFVMRHSRWVDNAFEAAVDMYGDDDGCYAGMKAECSDRFLVVAFILATEYYFYHQLELDNNGGRLTKKQINELRRQVKQTRYDGGF
jgi:ssDNA-binding Zn-finger/Zn-ribbon topoisomerase 1